MSKVAIQGNASGTGTFTIAAPNSNTDRTLTLPDEAGTVLTSATPVVAQKGVPAFSAYQSAGQTLSSAVYTKIQYNTEHFDTTAAYDTALYRFTPLVAGYYQVNVVFNLANGTESFGIIYKNGSQHRAITDAGPGYGSSGSVLIYLNGTTDYLEFYGYSIPSRNTAAGTMINHWSAFLAIAA